MDAEIYTIAASGGSGLLILAVVYNGIRKSMDRHNEMASDRQVADAASRARAITLLEETVNELRELRRK